MIEKLEELGAKVDYNDPHVPRTHRMRRHDLQMESVPLTPEALASYDCVVISTHHSAYNWQEVADHAQADRGYAERHAAVKGRREHIVGA